MRFFENKKNLFLAALAVRFLAGWWLGHFSHPDTWESEAITNNLLANKGFLFDRQHLGISYYAYALPAYPFFCALVYGATHHNQALLLILQCLLSAASCLQIVAIGRLVFAQPAVAWIGAWLTALHPGLVYYAGLLHPLTLDLFSYLWVLWGFLVLVKKPTAGKALILGLGAGFALLSRGTILLFLVLAMALFLWRSPSRSAFRKAVPIAAVVTLTTLALVLPWLARNAALFHRFPVFITTSGQSFWQGNNPISIGTAHLPDGQPIICQLSPSLQEELARSTEIGQNNIFRREAGAFIRQHPWAAVRLFLRKYFIFWWFSPTIGVYYPKIYTLGYGLYYSVIAVLALLGIWSIRGRLFSVPLFLLITLLLSVAFFQSFYYVEGRHRWAVEPVLLLFSACGALHFAGGSVTQRTSRSYSLLWRQSFGRPMGNDSRSYHLDEIRDSLGLDAPEGKVLDAGCGEGVDLANQGKRPGVKIVGVELSAGGCWASAQRTREIAAAHVVQADLSRLPFISNAFDFVYSYGVLHHMASPSSGLSELVRAAKPGAWVALYLYEDFGERSPAWRILLGLSNLPRHLTTRLPHRLLYALCLLASPVIVLLFTVPFRLSQRIPFLERRTRRMPFRHASNPWDLGGDLYDRFATPIERRYSHASAQSLLREAGLRRIRIANRRGWMVAGVKPS